MKNLIQRKGVKSTGRGPTISSEKSEQECDPDISTEDEEESHTTETIQNVSNKITHDEENSSEDEDDPSEDENVTEMQTYEINGEKNVQEDKLLTTNFEVKVENRRVEGLIAHSTNQQIFKFKVNSGMD